MKIKDKYMDKNANWGRFWKWMKEKGYSYFESFTKKGLFGEEGKDYIDFPTKQMLIGYMIEYLFEEAHDYYHKFIDSLKKDISPEFIYEELKELIELEAAAYRERKGNTIETR